MDLHEHWGWSFTRLELASYKAMDLQEYQTAAEASHELTSCNGFARVSDWSFTDKLTLHKTMDVQEHQAEFEGPLIWANIM